MDWELAYHPYSIPMVEPEFWNDAETGLIKNNASSPVVNMINLNVLTDYLQQPQFLMRSGKPRHVILSEQGFTSPVSYTHLEFERERTQSFVGLCVLGGIFSEGIDLKEERLEGAIIVGTGLPMVCTEQEILKKYFEEQGENGYEMCIRDSLMATPTAWMCLARKKWRC